MNAANGSAVSKQCLNVVTLKTALLIMLPSILFSTRAETDTYISKFLGYPFEIHYPDPEPFRIVSNYFRQFGNAFSISK